MERIEHATPDITQENIRRIAELFPSVITEVVDSDGETNEAIDFDSLRELLGDSVDEGSERYQFTWPGKRAAKILARTPCDRTMRPEKGRSVSWETTNNLYIEGDNLEALKLLRETYAGTVDIIYIDPPYNTGGDLIYDDDFSGTLADYEEASGYVDEQGGRLVANPDTNGKFHSDWCSMIYPRILLARDFLTSDGVMFISIDEGESQNLRKICDEIFGASNFVAQLVWSGGRKNDSQLISVSHEYVLCYVKSMNYLKEHKIKWREKKQGLDQIYAAYDKFRAEFAGDHEAITEAMKSWYRSLPDDNPAKNHSHYASSDDRGLYFPDNISWPGGGGPRYEVLHPTTGKPVTIPSRGWLFGTPERMQELIEQDLIEFGPDERKVPCYKRYLSEHEYAVPYSVFYQDGRAASKRLATLMGDKVFDNPKDEDILARILSFNRNKHALIMDFFSGSATTAQAVFQLNAQDGGDRRFILVQVPEDLDENLARTSKQSAKKVIQSAIALCDSLGQAHSITTIGEERIRRAAAKVAREIEDTNSRLQLGEEPIALPDMGFRVLRIDSSNFIDTHLAPSQQTQASLFEMVDNLKDDRDGEDLLFQVLPTFRIPYTARIETFEVDGAQCFDVNEGQLIACFDEHVSTTVIEKIAQMRPIYAVFRDASLADDSAAANFEELFKTYSHETDRRVI